MSGVTPPCSLYPDLLPTSLHLSSPLGKTATPESRKPGRTARLVGTYFINTPGWVGGDGALFNIPVPSRPGRSRQPMDVLICLRDRGPRRLTCGGEQMPPNEQESPSLRPLNVTMSVGMPSFSVCILNIQKSRATVMSPELGSRW